MSEQKQLKKKLSMLKTYKSHLLRLIDCSNAFGDNYFRGKHLLEIDKKIEKLEKKIAEIDATNHYPFSDNPTPKGSK